MSVEEQLGVVDLAQGLAEARQLWQDWVEQDPRLASAPSVDGLRDWSRLVGIDAADEVLPHHDTHHGRDGVVNGVFGPTFASFDEFALRIDRIHDAGGVVVFEGRVTGLTKADGRPDAPAAWLWTVRDGRIVIYHNNDLE